MQDVVAGQRGGARDYLKKPFEPPELLARVASAAHVKHLQDTLRRRNAELDRMSRTDVLIGLYNRRHLDEELLRRIKDALRYHNPICLLLLDIDHFKRVNDTYGHPAGDLVLSTFAQRLSETLCAGDIPRRWGGEEFLVILPRSDLDGALVVAERVRSATAAAPVVVAGDDTSFTVSGGLALGPGASTAKLVHLADTCLYQAKAGGRNQIISATLASSSP